MKTDLKTLLSEGIVEFTFKKVNGETRKAKGSRNVSVLMATPESGFTEANKPNGSRAESPEVCNYWDFEKQAWRCARLDSIISVDKATSESEILGKSINF